MLSGVAIRLMVSPRSKARVGADLAGLGLRQDASARARYRAASVFVARHPRQAAVALHPGAVVAFRPQPPNKSFKPMPLRGTA